MVRSGRLIWVKSAMTAVPIYAMLAEKMSSWVREEIEAICRKLFLRGQGYFSQGKVHGQLANSGKINRTWWSRSSGSKALWLCQQTRWL